MHGCVFLISIFVTHPMSDYLIVTVVTYERVHVAGCLPETRRARRRCWSPSESWWFWKRGSSPARWTKDRGRLQGKQYIYISGWLFFCTSFWILLLRVYGHRVILMEGLHWLSLIFVKRSYLPTTPKHSSSTV